MRILLTGPGGFLGSALARHWVSCGHTLTLLARPASTLRRLQDMPGDLRVLRAANLREVASAVGAAEPDVIVHTACSYGRCGEPAYAIAEANIMLGVLILETAVDIASRKGKEISFINTGTVLAPEVSLYALSKRQFSAWGDALARREPSSIRFIDVQLQHMYGPGDDASKFTTHILEAFLRNDARLALSPGLQRRDFIYIDDAVKAYDCILEAHGTFAVTDTIEVGSGESVTLRSFVELAKRVSGATTYLDFGAFPYRAHEAMLYVADTGRLRRLGWRPRVSLEEGLSRLAARPAPRRI